MRIRVGLALLLAEVFTAGLLGARPAERGPGTRQQHDCARALCAEHSSRDVEPAEGECHRRPGIWIRRNAFCRRLEPHRNRHLRCLFVAADGGHDRRPSRRSAQPWKPVPSQVILESSSRLDAGSEHQLHHPRRCEAAGDGRMATVGAELQGRQRRDPEPAAADGPGVLRR